MRSGGNLSIANSIVAGNIAEGAPEIDFQHSTLVSGGHNLIGDSPGDSDDTGNSIEYQPTDILDTPPRLDPLGMYGGTTPTRRLQANSPAIDKGAATGQSSTDQRGLPRPVDDPAIPNAAGGDGSDIGAFEAQVAPSSASTSKPNTGRSEKSGPDPPRGVADPSRTSASASSVRASAEMSATPRAPARRENPTARRATRGELRPDGAALDPRLPVETIQSITMQWSRDNRNRSTAEATRVFEQGFDSGALKQMPGH